MNRTRADAFLLLTALIWGLTFVAQRAAAAHVGPIFFVGARFLASTLFLLPLALWEARKSKVDLSGRDWMCAGAIGACLCAGCWLQQVGLQTTSATNAGFLTAAYMVVVPFAAWAVSGQRPRPLVLAACSIAVYGAWLLGNSRDLAWSRGDLLILGSDLVWAAHITLVGHCRGIAGRPFLLSFVQCAITGVVSLPALFLQPATPDQFLAALPALAFAGIVSSGLAFTLQIVAQRHTPAAEAALIMSLESVFAAAFGALLLDESISLRAAIGAFLIMTGVVLVETAPLLAAAIGARLRRASKR